MGFLTTFLGIIGFSIGIPLGLFVGFFLFIYDKPKHVEYPIVTPLHELDVETLQDLLLEVPSWVKYSDYDRVDWLNKFVSDMWPYLDKVICGMIQSTTKPIFAEHVGSYQIKSIEFETLTLGVLPPTIYGMKVFETNEKELVLEPVLRWAGNPNITLVLKLLSVPIVVQLVDLQIFATPRITLAPLVPSFPCFSNVVVSLMEKPHIDFGMKVLGGDIMAIPGLYIYVQETIKKQIARLYLWPQTLKIPILDCSVISTKKPVGILHVKVIRALKLLKKDILGSSDPYVKLGLSGERLQSKKTSVKMNNLNPEWNEEFKLIVKDPESQVLQLQVFDWDKVGEHDNLGMQVVPLSMLVPQETKSFSLDLVKHLNSNDTQNKKKRGQLIVELTFNLFREDFQRFSGSLLDRKESSTRSVSEDTHSSGAGVLLVVIQGAEDVEGKNHNNPYAIVVFRGRHKKTKMIKRTRDPTWNEEFQFVVDEAPVNDKIHIQIMSKKRGLSCRGKESLGHVDINLVDVVNNGRLNEKYHLINSKNGLIHVEIRWKTI